jgi:hypothetical protein
MSYNSAALTNITSAGLSDGTGTIRVNQRYLVAPSTGSNTFTVNYSNSGSNCYDQAIAGISLTGVDQTTPIGTAATATGLTSTPTVTVTSAANEMVVDVAASSTTLTFAVGAGQTQRANLTGGSAFMYLLSSTEPGAASTTMSWTGTGSAWQWSAMATPFKPVSGGGGGSTIYNRLLMGVGF